MIKSRIAAAAALLAVAGAASAGTFSVTPTIASDYDFRGLTQTDKDPAFQLGGTYTLDSGFYVGAWGSNVDFGPGDPNVEIDYYAGFAGGDATDGIGYDIGAIYYSYPGAGAANSLEVYAGITKGIFGAKLWFSDDLASSDNEGFYAEGNINYPLASGFSLLAHVGYSFGDAWKPNEYVDYAAGVGYTINNFALAAKYVNSNDLPGAGRDAVIFSVSTTLPWSAE
jgi:uncharacterized protein (TIGR02001 family)